MEKRTAPIEVVDVKTYQIVACGEIRELEKAVSEILNRGGFYLVGRPFEFRNQICQAITRKGLVG